MKHKITVLIKSTSHFGETDNRQVNVVPLAMSKRMISKKIKQDGLWSVGVKLASLNGVVWGPIGKASFESYLQGQVG